MPFGEYRRLDLVVKQNDTAPLRAYTYSEANVPVPGEEILGVEWVIRPPGGASDGSDDETIPSDFEEDGAAVLLFDGTTDLGEYIALARFTLADGTVRSERRVFSVEDPFVNAPTSAHETIAEAVWLRLSDLFDSEEGGPWLGDVTKSFFDKRKIAALIDDAVLDIGLAPPHTPNITIIDFTGGVTTITDLDGSPLEQADPDQNVLVQGALIAVIRHLIRSYAEQPVVTGAQVVYEDRTRYLQNWQSVLQAEEARYTRLVALWKRQFLGLGKTSLLVHSKAGRLTNLQPRSWAARRGYW